MLSFRVKTAIVAAGAVMTLGAAQPASAASIMGLYNTGVDNSGNVLAAGSAEQHYVITASTRPGLALPTTPTVVSSASWSANDAAGGPGSSWITPISNGSGGPATLGFPVSQTYDYDLVFSLGTLNAATAMLSGSVQSDNFVTVLLNGVAIAGQPQAPVGSPGDVNYFRNFSAFGTASGFQMGTNTLTFRVTDYGVISGLRVGDLVGTAVPEPGVWAMLIVGFGLVASQIRRRRRQGPLAIA